jgi:gamma-glutamyltranspeptidase/glutathione hydrolase
MVRPASWFRSVWLSAIATSCALPAGETTRTPAPETGKRAVAEHAVVTSASPWASEAGLAVLRDGGNAVDAAVATAFALGVAEPQMSGLGGGGSALVWMQADRLVEYLDFYSAQPAAAFRRPGAAVEPAGSDLRVVAVPGEVAGLKALHERFGRLPWPRLLVPAIRLAEDGFPVNQILAQMIQDEREKVAAFDASAAHLFPGGEPLPAGHRLRNPALARALRAVAAQGAAGFHQGDVAREVVAAMNAGGHPVTLVDFGGFRPQWKRPLCTDYRGRIVLGAPPPQTGAHVLHALELLEPFDIASLGLPHRSAEAFDVVASALRVAAADNRGNNDPNWASVPAAGLASEAYARSRAQLVGTGTVAARVEPGDAAAFDDTPPPDVCAPFDPWGPAVPPPGEPGLLRHDDTSTDSSGETTHISVVDADGNAVALTQTNSTVFGSGAMAAGFFLNDSGYRFDAESAARPARSEWRTRTSTIAPTIVLENGRVRLVVGAPGGGRIPATIAQNIVYALDLGLDPMEAVRLPRLLPAAANPRVELEHGFAPAVLERIRAAGWEPTPESAGYARIYMIVRVGDRWIGVADPRHDGEARGY